MDLFSGVVPVALKHSLNGTLLRHKAIAHNIANVNTPKFKRVDVDFKSQLKAAISQSTENSVHTPKTRLGHIPIDPPRLGGITPRIYQQSDTSLRIDQNNVDIDVEMGTLAVNTMEYNVLVRMITDYYQKITMVIRTR